MPTRNLPNSPRLEHLKNQAKTLLKQVRAKDPEAVALAAEFHPVSTLADAQVVIARSYGFGSWPRLVHHLELVDRYSRSPHEQPTSGPLDTPGQRSDEFLRLAILHYGQDDPARQDAAARLLAEYPEIALSNIYTQVVAGEVEAVRASLTKDRTLARREGGPFRWEPLLYLSYSRLPIDAPLEIARLLLTNGADPNAGFLWDGLPSPFTALTGAFGRGEGDQPPHQSRLELARLLLEAGADANDSQTMYNCGPGCAPPYDDDHLELLLEFGLGKGDGGPWHQRLTTAHPTPKQLLEDELVFASSRGLLHRVELMLAQGVDPDRRGTEHPIFVGHRAYELAATQGYDEVATLLLAAGAAPLDEIHELYAAAFRGESVHVDAELAARAVRRNPHIPLKAAELGRTEALEPLRDLGFDLFMPGRITPLHQAAFSGHLDTVKKLIALGADPTLVEPAYQSTPRGWAEHNHQQEVVDYLDNLKD
ncbi:ankyrin repeat domain-containing protein [Streptomyces sp. SID13031]|uniref:ankyrin repeat domain-containing protein n=1 Tax=Streptomyces sp. SID13031 TaxID=2706046 RepID=UPI0013CB2B3A|nr:ankyrin repeat domain-containing protein [Streptomyces sp. SID13031]NEA36474.1 ankyrin repeat domain-containing protein [Streptomyces sp. SID13031]